MSVDQTVLCSGCGGTGRRYNSPFASRMGTCRDCGGSGRVEPDEDER